MNNQLTDAERKHLESVKSLPCSVCGAPPPSSAHHINQGQQYTTVALCPDCHQGSHNGWHGRRAIWKVQKMDELDALNITIKNLLKTTQKGWSLTDG
jgi:hypothetical protein